MSPDMMVAALLRREGGFIDHAADRGGPTKYGITQKTLSSWRGREVTFREVQTLTEKEASQIYSARYYYGAQVDKLPEALQPAMFDACVNHGVRNAWKLLQYAAGTAEDGIPGEATFRAIDGCNVIALCRAFIDVRREFYVSIAERDPSQRVFLKGWLARLEAFA